MLFTKRQPRHFASGQLTPCRKRHDGCSLTTGPIFFILHALRCRQAGVVRAAAAESGARADAEPDLILVEGQRGESDARTATVEALETGLREDGLGDDAASRQRRRLRYNASDQTRPVSHE